MNTNTIYNKLKLATQESQVQEIYNEAFKDKFNISLIDRKYQCDGYFKIKNSDNKDISVLIEYKYDIQMKDRVQRSKTIAQCLGYIKKFEDNGEAIPKVVFIGDINECCMIHTNDLIKFLDVDDVDWTISPCSMGDSNPNLVFEIAKSITPWVYDVNEDFNFNYVVDRIIDLCNNTNRKLHITEKNIEKVYNIFCDRIIKDKKKIQANDLVGCFIGAMLDKDNYYQHPKKKNILIANGKPIAINGDQFELFMDMHSTEYSPKEKRIMTAISDRLIEDTNRRNKGEFYTPTLFVDYAHSMIEKELGSRWKEGYVVWDCCYDSETEFLSDKGWKLIKDYNENDFVAQYNTDGIINFVKPKRYISQEYTGKWLHLYGSQIDIKCTPDHNFVVIDDHYDRHKGAFKQSAQEVYDRQQRCKNTHLSFIKTFKYNGNIHVNEWVIRLAIAINADGYYNNKLVLNNHKDRTSRNTRFTTDDTSERNVYTISLKKERKIKRLDWILEHGKFEFTKHQHNDCVNFNIKFPYFDGKHFPKNWYHLDEASKNIFLDEIYNWDGNIQDTKHGIRKSYFTNKKDDCDLVQFIINSMNCGTTMRLDARTNNINYIVHPVSHKTAKVSNRHNKFVEESDQNNMCYCFEVDSGMLLVRRNNKIIVSSNCCGTKNLTRDYRFKELYCSTLEQAELDISSKYNKEAVSFQFDFLNDSLDDLKVKAPGLLEAFELNKPIVFFLNPPYGSNCGLGTVNRNKSLIAAEMNKLNMKSASSVLYGEFLYRICLIKKKYNLTNLYIALFCKPSFMSLENFSTFREYFLNDFNFINGVLFNAGHFANVSTTWGITFNLWKSEICTNKKIFKHTLLDVKDNSIKIIGEKNIYNIDNECSAKKWMELKVRNNKKDFMIGAVAPIKIYDKQVKGVIDSLGYLYSNGNSCLYNQTFLAFMSVPMYKNVTSISINNFCEAVSYFSARSLIQSNWINDKDEYIAPNESHLKFQEFVNDSIIYSIFGGGFTSLRNINIHNKLWNIKNEFFWLSKQEIMDLAEEYNNDYCYEDALSSDERFVYTKLQEIKDELSTEAKSVLDKATELVNTSFKYRQLFDESHPEYQINNWDCGWYQIKALLKEFMPNELKEFRVIYKKLADKMRPMVYELGFLKK